MWKTWWILMVYWHYYLSSWIMVMERVGRFWTTIVSRRLETFSKLRFLERDRTTRTHGTPWMRRWLWHLSPCLAFGPWQHLWLPALEGGKMCEDGEEKKVPGIGWSSWKSWRSKRSLGGPLKKVYIWASSFLTPSASPLPPPTPQALSSLEKKVRIMTLQTI